MTEELLVPFRNDLVREVRENILSHWIAHSRDDRDAGFVGLADRTWMPDFHAPKAGILNTRILWTFSEAYRLFALPEYLQMADRAFRYIREKFLDPVYGGIFWDLTPAGEPLTVKKQIYAQAFALYSFSAYYRATREAGALELAKSLFSLIEERGFDPGSGGYIEACSRDWKPVEDMRLSETDMNTPKSMNTHLHVLEAFTGLCRVWEEPAPRTALKGLLRTVIDRLINPETAHFILFSGMDWTPMSDHISYGHDIEGSWLLYEAALVLGDPELLRETEALALRMAEAVLHEGTAKDGSVISEAGPSGWLSLNRDWWPQAEGVVGFFNAWQLSGDEKYFAASRGCWDFIRRFIIDPVYGEWVWGVDGNGKIYRGEKLGPWKCPYHNARACFEILERTEKEEN